jgi:type I restriction enzyme S subunit
MSVNWTVESLGSIAEMTTDKVSINDLSVASYISTENLLPNRGGVEIAQKIPPSGNVNAFQAGDVLFSNIRTYFKKVWLASWNGGASADVIIFRPRDNQKIQSQYLFYLISSDAFIESTVTASKGTKMPRGDKDAMRNYEFSLPPLVTQQRIAGILSSYDELIENSQQRIKILESMARVLYREWFVYFRYPDHESVPLVPSALGDIPQGWNVLELRHLFDIRYGKTLPKTEISHSGPYPVYGAGDVIGFYEKMLCINKCALVTSRGNGSGTVWRTRETAFITNNSLIVEPKENLSHWDYSFVELLLKHSNVMGAKTGSAQPQITIENLNYVKAIAPTGPLVKQFCAIVTPLYDQVDLLFRRVQNLRATRDLLLPRLLSGQIEVEATAS